MGILTGIGTVIGGMVLLWIGLLLMTWFTTVLLGITTALGGVFGWPVRKLGVAQYLVFAKFVTEWALLIWFVCLLAGIAGAFFNWGWAVAVGEFGNKAFAVGLISAFLFGMGRSAVLAQLRDQ